MQVPLHPAEEENKFELNVHFIYWAQYWRDGKRKLFQVGWQSMATAGP